MANKQAVINEALKMLRSQGVRVPRKFSSRLERHQNFTLSKTDIKDIEAALIADENKIIVVTLRGDKVNIHSYKSYASMLKTAENARKFAPKAEVNGHSKEPVHV